MKIADELEINGTDPRPRKDTCVRPERLVSEHLASHGTPRMYAKLANTCLSMPWHLVTKNPRVPHI